MSLQFPPRQASEGLVFVVIVVCYFIFYLLVSSILWLLLFSHKPQCRGRGGCMGVRKAERIICPVLKPMALNELLEVLPRIGESSVRKVLVHKHEDPSSILRTT